MQVAKTNVYKMLRELEVEGTKRGTNDAEVK